MASSQMVVESGGSTWKFVAIGVVAAVSGTLLKLLQGTEQANVLLTSLAYLVATLLPAALTYLLLARDQEQKLREVSRTLGVAQQKMKDLRSVVDIEKNYYANERLLNVERRVIQETGSSMQEVAELVSAFGDNDIAHVKLKERFRLHAKSILTFHHAFQFEVEQNFKSMAEVENEFLQMPHDKRDELIYTTGKARTEQLSERYELGSIVGGIKLLTERSSENAQLAAVTHESIVKALNVGEVEGGKE